MCGKPASTVWSGFVTLKGGRDSFAPAELELMALFFRDPLPPPVPELQEGRKRLPPVLKRIGERLGEKITVEDLARLARYEKSHSLQGVQAGHGALSPRLSQGP